MPDLIQMLTGATGDELKTEGQRLYPNESDPLNRTAHRAGARRLTQRFGVLPTQALGIGNELWEAYNRWRAGSEAPLVGRGEENPDVMIDVGDIGANLRGSADVVAPGWEQAGAALLRGFQGR
jgi:hypothetical protein